MPMWNRHVFWMAIVICSCLKSAHAGRISASADYAPGGTPGGGVPIVDASGATVSLSLSDPGTTIKKVTVSVNVTKSGSEINPDGTVAGSGFTFNREMVLELTSPAGTTVQLVAEETYDGQDSPPNAELVELIFDDDAGTAIGGLAIVSGTFAPVGSLSDFIGEDPTGNWTLFFLDTVGSDPLSVNAWSLEVETVPEPNSVILAGMGMGLVVGFVAKRNRRQGPTSIRPHR